MKKINVLFAMLFCVAFQSCCLFGDCEEVEFPDFETAYEPIYLNRGDFENSVILKDKLPIDTSGKIYVKDNFLFINELNKGFHVYDNSDPSNPVATKFIKAPGSTDLAIRENIIYINQATDLIAVEYNTNTNELSLTKRVENAFPPLRSPDGFDAYNIPENSVVVDWKLKN